MNKPKVTICLLTWNGAHYLPWLLKSLTQQTFTDWELLVLDNSSVDNSPSVVREYYPPAKVIEQKHNLGFAKGHNLLINWSKSDYVLFLNQDIMLDPDYLEKTVAFMETNPMAASVSGKLMYWDFHGNVTTKIIDSLGIKLDRKRQAMDIDQGKQDYTVVNHEVFGLSASAMLVRRQCLEKIKYDKGNGNFEYFDEDFFSYKEDIDLAWRLRINGWENWLLADTKAYHHRTVSNQGLKQRKERGFANKMSYRNHFCLLYKNSFAKNFFKDFFQITWYELKKFIYLLILERKTIKGLWEFLGLRSKLKDKRRQIKKYRQVKTEDIYRWFV